jgi:predicted glycogen debranching enzyme
MHTVRRLVRARPDSSERSAPIPEWLVTNGLGGYAAGTPSGVVTRRYHGLLIAALPAPLGRWLVFSHLSERVRLPSNATWELGSAIPLTAPSAFEWDFQLECGLPVWTYRGAGITIEKRILLPHAQNSTYVKYRLLEGSGPVRLTLMPSVHSRSHDAPVTTPLPGAFVVQEADGRYDVAMAERPTLRLRAYGRSTAFTVERHEIPEVVFPAEEERGYEHRGSLWSPGYFKAELTEHDPVVLVASTEPWSTIDALAPEAAFSLELERRSRLVQAAMPPAREGIGAELVLAADQFVMRPASRSGDVARAHAEGGDARSVIAGYHWFTDWGRDTMISLEGLTLVTGRHAEAGYILRTFAYAIRDGLIPNLFPEGESEGRYHTADATLWLFHAIDRYVTMSGDRQLVADLLPRLEEIAKRHLEGTRFGIVADPADGLLRQGAVGYQLTWMDAKVGDWVVTPRRGKAVEINALWYNALCVLTRWISERDGESAAGPWREHADRVRVSFADRFWSDNLGHLYDVVDGEEGDDGACRPNQLFAISLPHPVLDQAHWASVLQVVADRLVTPVGLRSLAPGHPDYKAHYHGDIFARDAAYHQGTVWAWLIGPFIDAWLRVYPDDVAGARRWLTGFETHLGEACVGSISEVFDAEAPFLPRGCVAQAWSVAEVLRSWVRVTNALETTIPALETHA